MHQPINLRRYLLLLITSAAWFLGITMLIYAFMLNRTYTEVTLFFHNGEYADARITKSGYLNNPHDKRQGYVEVVYTDNANKTVVSQTLVDDPGMYKEGMMLKIIYKKTETSRSEISGHLTRQLNRYYNLYRPAVVIAIFFLAAGVFLAYFISTERKRGLIS